MACQASGLLPACVVIRRLRHRDLLLPVRLGRAMPGGQVLRIDTQRREIHDGKRRLRIPGCRLVPFLNSCPPHVKPTPALQTTWAGRPPLRAGPDAARPARLCACQADARGVLPPQKTPFSGPMGTAMACRAGKHIWIKEPAAFS